MKGPSVTPFYTGEIGRLLGLRDRAGLPTVPMHYGQPTAGAPARAIEVAHRIIDEDSLGYAELPALRERISAYYAQRHGVQVDPERILLTSGASAALVVAYCALFETGDRIALVRPGYPAYRNTLRALRLEPHEIPCGAETQFRLTPAMIEALPEGIAGIVIASPANPTGAMLDGAELSAVLAACRERRIQVISDEIYHGISYGRADACALEFDDRAVIINSFSKLYRMPGWRLGWLVAPSGWAPVMHSYVINMFLTASAVAQHAAVAAMDEGPDLEEWVRIYARNRARLIEGLAALGIHRLAPPDGAFYLYADIGHLTNDSMQFCLRAAEEIGVGMAPGIDFDPDDGHRYVRFSFAVTPEEIELALELLAAWLPGVRASGAPST